MAFHPFSFFRKHQKVMFAVLTILCMIVFIFQFGSGDPFSRLLGKGNAGKGDKVVTLFGRDVYSADIDQIHQSRQMANDLIHTALGDKDAQDAAFKAVVFYKADDKDPTDKDIGDLLGKCIDRKTKLDDDYEKLQSTKKEERDQASQDLQFASFIYPQEIKNDYAKVTELRGRLAAEKSDPAKAKDQEKVLVNLRYLLRNQYASLTGAGNPFYFGGGVKPEDLIDFEIWKHQADKLGVVLTKADARRALAYEAGGNGLPADPGGAWKDDPAFKAYFANHGQVTEDQAATALEDEFRVRIVQGLMGAAPGGLDVLGPDSRPSPDPIAPYDFWTYYRDNRTTVTPALLKVPVDFFLKQVTATPSEQDLRDLFADHRSEEPKPDKPTPSFKEPRRIRIAFVTARTDSDYYKKWSDDAKFNVDRFYVTAFLGGHLAGGGVAPAAAEAGLLYGDPLQSDYATAYFDRYKFEFGEAGALAGLGSGGFPPFSVPTASLAAAEEQAKDPGRRLVAAAFLSAVDASAAGTPLAGLVPAAASLPLPFSRDETIARLLEQHRKDAAPNVVEDDVTQFATDLQKAMKTARDEAEKKLAADKDSDLDPDKVANDTAEELIRKTAKDRGWDLNENVGLYDRYEVETAADLQPVREAYGSADPKGFGELLFKDLPPGLYEPLRPKSIGPDKTKFVTLWRTEDVRDRELSYDEARPRVLAAWRQQEARKLALREAERISDAARGQPLTKEAVQSLKDEAVKYVTDKEKLDDLFFELSDIARIVPGPTPDSGHEWAYSRYKIPENQIPYPPPDLLDRLLALDKPGKTMIFKDRPATHFYVVVLENRVLLDIQDKDPKTQLTFADVYDGASQPGKDQLWRQFFLADRDKEQQKTLMRQLREEAAGADNVNEQGQIKLTGKAGQPSQPNGSEGGDEGSDMPPLGL